MIEKIKKNILFAIILSSIIYLAFSFYADFDSVVYGITHFDLSVLSLVLLLTSTNFFFRFLKWHYYLNLLNIKVKFQDSFLIFHSGLIMSVTPGKFGEVLKSFLLKKLKGTEISVSAPIVLAERVTDFFSLLILAAIGTIVFDYGVFAVAAISLVFIVLTVLINNRNLSLKFISALERMKFIEKHAHKLHSAYESSYKMLKIKPLYKMTFLSLLAWLPECFGFYLILTNFEASVSIVWSIFVYTFSIIIGALTLLPAGIGVTEGSLLYFVTEKVNSTGTAVSVTLLIRLATLWYAVFIGIIALIYFKKKNKIAIN